VGGSPRRASNPPRIKAESQDAAAALTEVSIMTGLAILIGSIVLFLLSKVWSTRRRKKRANFIRSYPFPNGLLDRLAARYPSLSTHDRHLVSRALRQFFLVYLASGRRFVSMPSRVTDDLWHEFILYTRHYDAFCRRAFGRFLHHTPAVVMGSDRLGNAGLRRAWWFACREERLDPKKPARLPLLFALDAQLGIEDGFRYALDCHAQRGIVEDDPVHCIADLASGGFDGSSDGCGGSWFGCDGGDGGDGGGCGGD